MIEILRRAQTWLSDERRQTLSDVGLLLLRVGFGAAMLFGHGWGKLLAFGERAESFPDPLGVGNQLSMVLAISAEVCCSLLLILGLATRAVAVPLIVTMLVAALIVHGDDPWKKKEMAVLYLIPYLTFVLTGPGRFSLDALIAKKLAAGKPAPSE